VVVSGTTVGQTPLIGDELWISAQARCANSARLVATGCFGHSPSGDRIYITQLEVLHAFQRAGFGAAFVLAMAKHRGPLLPVTPIRETWVGRPFWDALRSGHVPGLVVTEELIRD